MAEIIGGEIRKRVGDAEEVVGDAAALVFGDLVGGDVKPLEDLDLIRIDDLGGEARGEVDGEAGLAGAGAAYNEDDLVFAAEEGLHFEAFNDSAAA